MISSIVIALLPHYPSLWASFGAIFINGIGGGAYESAIGVWLIEMWSETPFASAMLQGIAFAYGLGAISAPLLVAPHVHGEANMTNDGERNLTIQDRVEDLT